jgi:hypothetical protein
MADCLYERISVMHMLGVGNALTFPSAPQVDQSPWLLQCALGWLVTLALYNCMVLVGPPQILISHTSRQRWR